MRTDKPDDMAVLVRRGDPRGARAHRLCVLCGMTLRPGQCAELLPEARLWSAVAQTLGPDGSLDAGLPARGAQVLLQGRAWAHAGQPVRHLQVALRLLAPPTAGQAPAPLLEKRLDVHADRELDASGPRPADAGFVDMPLDLSRAFGGPGHAANPSGRGAGPMLVDGRERWSMPNVEVPDDPLRRRGQQVAVATLGPLPARERAGSAAQAQERAQQWLQAWPHAELPAQQAHAPRDQWLPQGLRGDEQLHLAHLHPTHTQLHCALHGRRPMFRWIEAPSNGDASPRVHDVSLRAHTLWLFPERLLAVLLYDAPLPGACDPDAREHWLMGSWESPGQAAPDAAACLRRWRDLQPPEVPREPPPARPAPTRPAGRSPDPPPSTTPQQQTDDMLRRLRRRGWTPQQIDRLRQRGWLPEQPPPEPPLEQLLQQLQAETDILRRKHAIDDSVIDRFLRQAAEDPPPAASPGTPQAALADALQQLERDTQRALRRAGLSEQQAAQYLRRHDAGLAQALERMQQPAAAAPGANAARAEAPGVGGGEPHGTAATSPDKPTRADVQRWLLDGTPLRRRTLDGLDLRGLDFSGADMRGVHARGAVFTACRMDHVDLRDALLHDADLREAELRGANLAGSRWARARLAKACLAEADCRACDFTQSALGEVVLDGACLQHALFEKTDLRRASAVRCDARGTQWARCDLQHSDWHGARLAGSAWLDCALQHACLDDVEAPDVNLDGSDASDARFARADLRGSRATERTVLQRADLRRADLRGACWEGARLHDADLADCRLQAADLSLARAQRAVLRSVDGTTLRLDGADLRGADLRGAKLLQASLAGADLRTALLDGAMCFGADLADLRCDPDTLAGADVRRSVAAARERDLPAPTERGEA